MRKFGVVKAVHALVAKVFRELEHPVVAAHNEAFKIELVGNAQIKGSVEGVVVGFERPRRRPAVERLQNGRFHFQIALFFQKSPHGVYQTGAFYKHVAHLRIDNQIHIALAVALFGIGKGVVGLPVFFFDNGQGAQRLAEHGERLDVYADFAHLGDEHKAGYADNVANVGQFFEYLIIEGFVFALADFVTLDIELNPPLGILQFGKRGRAHNASAHQTAGNADFLKFFGILFKLRFNLFGMNIDLKFGGRVGLDTQFLQFFERLTSVNLLIGEFHGKPFFYKVYVGEARKI